MLNDLLVRTALLVGPKATVTNNFTSSRKRYGPRLACVTAELRPRAVHLYAAECALGCTLAELGFPNGCVWHTTNTGNSYSDLQRSDALSGALTMRQIVQKRLNDPAAALAELNEYKGVDWANLGTFEREEMVIKRYDLDYTQRHAERIERLLCARNPFQPTASRRFTQRVLALN